MDYTPTIDDGHRIDLDLPTGTEYIAGAIDILDPNFFIDYAEEFNFEKLYMQLEFEKKYSGGAYDYGKCLCTIYGPIETLSIILGREITLQERLELVQLRIAEKDFDPAVGGFTSVGVDVARRWYNRKYPSDPIVTQMINDKAVLKKLFTKNIPLVTSLRANKEFTLDTIDGTMDELNYWNFPGPRYGHCRTRRALRIHDNYYNEYRYKRIADIELCMNNSFESRNCFIFFRESWLSDMGKRYLKAQREGLWNGSNPDTKLIRQDAAAIAVRKNKFIVPASQVWNKLNGTKAITKYEWSAMLNKASGGSWPIYDGDDKNTTITRGEAILSITA